MRSWIGPAVVHRLIVFQYHTPRWALRPQTLGDTVIRLKYLFFSASLLVVPAIAIATESAQENAEAQPQCPTGPLAREMLSSLGGTAIVTIVAGLFLVRTLARSLAGSGYTQSSSNIAAFGLAAFMGGSVGTAVMAAGDCSVANVPGGLSLGVALVGLVAFLFSLATGKS